MQCKEGFIERFGRCVRKPSTLGMTSCVLDGKQFCDPKDKPLKPPIARAGGKSQIAQKIIEKAPPHKVYVEPFVGGGAVFLKKPLAERSIINDKDTDVTTAFKSFKEGSGFSKCDMTPSKEKFDRIKNKADKTACDVAYLNKLSFGSNMKSYALGDNQNVKVQNNPSYKKRWGHVIGNKEAGIGYQVKHLEDYKNKLQRVKIENKDFKQVMQENDSPNTFHYLDPPYDGTQGVYKEGKTLQPEEVCSVAKKMKGKVLISYNDSPRVRNACSGLKIEKINTRYTLGANSNNRGAREVLIKNY